MKPATAESYRLYALAGALMIAGPFWHYLYVNRYPFARPEALVLTLAAVMVGVVPALLARRIGGLIGTLIYGGLVFAFVDLQFDLEPHVYTWVLAAACLGTAALLRSHRAALTGVTLGAFYLAALPRPSHRWAAAPDAAAVGPVATPPPMLLHVILDEQWGIGGFRGAGDSATAAELTAFYLDRGFEVYEAAYSRWHETMRSLSAEMALGGSVAVDTGAGDGPGRFVYRLRDNPYFARLRALGYGVAVYESTYLDFCRAAAAPVTRCVVAPGNSIGNIGHLDGRWTTRAMLAARFFISTNSHVYRRLHPDAWTWRRASAGGAMAMLEQMGEDIAAEPGDGRAIVAHLMLPHRPVSVDSACTAFADPDRRVDYDDPVRLSDAQWRRRLALMRGQVLCTHRLLGTLLDQLDSAAGAGRAIVIVQGDHGSRMNQVSGGARLADLDARQLNGLYATLFAIRRPGRAARLHPEPAPVQDVLRDLVAAGFQGDLAGDWPDYVRVTPTDSVPDDTLRVLGRGEMLWIRGTGAVHERASGAAAWR